MNNARFIVLFFEFPLDNMLIYRVEWPERWIEEFGGGAHKGRKNVMFVQTCVSIFVKTRIIYLIYNDE